MILNNKFLAYEHNKCFLYVYVYLELFKFFTPAAGRVWLFSANGL